ncbi:Pol polyprotein [Elysia marginata]|uniref:Pol polyprotein n=1 Tax=Elysia marginata TaxID=1093978 RepID=A0AAV4H641_9GAST|nr:Pol polyprotein [Elysia marginata]
MLIRLMRYKPIARYCPGPTMVTSDALFHCSSTTDESEQKLQGDVQFHVDVITSSCPVSAGKLTEIRKKTQEDVILKAAFDYTMGDPVLIKIDGEKGWKQSGTILEQCAPKSYNIITPRGDIRRNRKHVMLCPNHHHPADEPVSNTVLDEQLKFSAIPEPQFEASQNLQNEAGPPT